MDERYEKFEEIFSHGMVSHDFISWLNDNGFFDAPASTKYHGNYAGGLFDHSFEVMTALVKLTDQLHLHWQNERSPYIVGMFHDLCKIDCYRHPSLGIKANGDEISDTAKWEYNPDTLLTGHRDKSVMLLAQHLQLTEEEALCIRYHMGAYTEKEEWKYYGAAIEKYPNVLYTHTADMIASKIIKI